MSSLPGHPHPEVLKPRRLTWALVLLISAAFVAIGLMVLRDPKTPGDRAWATVGVIFFGLGVIVSLIQFVPGSSLLRLTPEGLATRTMWRTTTYRWTDIERFGVAHGLVGIDFVAAYPRGRAAQSLMNLNRILTGFEGALPDTYGRSAAELADHLNQLQSRYTTPA